MNPTPNPGRHRFSAEDARRGRNRPAEPAHVSPGSRQRRRPGPPPGGPTGERTERARYYAAQAERVELLNLAHRGEHVALADVKARWSRRVIAYREAALNLVAVAVQRGLVARDREAELQALVDGMLRRLADRGRDD